MRNKHQQGLWAPDISGIIINFADLKRRTGNVTLKVPLLNLSKFLMVIILGWSLGREDAKTISPKTTPKLIRTTCIDGECRNKNQ